MARQQKSKKQKSKKQNPKKLEVRSTAAGGRQDPENKRTIPERICGIFLPKRKGLKTNRFMLSSSILVVALFFGLISYLVKFTLYDAADVINNAYNKRTTNLSELTRRGSILSANGKVLAQSAVDEDGEETREYPYENMFAHVVGYIGHGKTGLESAYNYDLLTSDISILSQIQNGLSGQKNEGNSIVTTLDTRLQKAAYEALGDYQGAVIAIEPKTGKVRAMVSKPDFDPNELDEIWDEINADDDNSCLVNRCTQGLYPPGSTYKIITALAYMEQYPHSYGDFTYNCTGETIINSVHISCYEEEAHGEVDLARAFQKSCNTAFVTLGCSLDLEKLVDLNETCLFNQKISFDLSVKKSTFGLTADSADSQIPQAVIGQGDTLMTPFHNALLMCAVANDGILMKPYLVEEVVSAEGETIESTTPEEYKTLMDENYAQKLQEMLVSVVTDGTGYALDTDQYTAAGKTGTAENENENAHSWFVGYSNVDDPDLVVCVIVENTGAGSKYAAPIAREVFDSYYNNEMDEEYR